MVVFVEVTPVFDVAGDGGVGRGGVGLCVGNGSNDAASLVDVSVAEKSSPQPAISAIQHVEASKCRLTGEGTRPVVWSVNGRWSER